MNFSARDTELMARAIQLAKRGKFTTTPNPNVGCVIAAPSGTVVGEGWHQKAGQAHAEVNALAQAGALACGATAYVTLEPCSHTGRTPPCASALIKAGVVRVVAAMQDPNPLVAGNGLRLLNEAGIATASGLLQTQAERLNRGFIKRMVSGRPWITVKMATSLDGKTALANGTSQWITGPEARRDVQLHRAQSCAILSGSGTVLADNPSLNVRPKELLQADIRVDQLRQPLRIILDGRSQLSAGLTLFGLPGETLIINSRSNPQDFGERVSQWQSPYHNNKLNLHAVMDHLGSLHLNQVWVEAGGMLAGALLENNLVDELILYQAPKLLGDKGQNAFTMLELSTMDQAFNLKIQDVRQVGKDTKITALIDYS